MIKRQMYGRAGFDLLRKRVTLHPALPDHKIRGRAELRDRSHFEVLPRRWVVERTFAWISKHRRTVRDYERLPASHEAMILWAMIALMARRLACSRP